MKRGITSGIVYPALVLTLSRDDRFRCIGGTSAGAIAAAVRAAAEYGRKAKGFEKLDQVREHLGQGGGKRSDGESLATQPMRPQEASIRQRDCGFWASPTMGTKRTGSSTSCLRPSPVRRTLTKSCS